jgi:hypothetical protein
MPVRQHNSIEDCEESWRRDTHILTSALAEGVRSASYTGRFNPKERALVTYWGIDRPQNILDIEMKRKFPASILNRTNAARHFTGLRQGLFYLISWHLASVT